MRDTSAASPEARKTEEASPKELLPGDGAKSNGSTPGRAKFETNPQPNLRNDEFPLRLWPALLLTGAFAGLAGGLLMKLLRLVQHVSFDYHQGDFLSGVEGVSGTHRIVVLVLAGILAGFALFFVKKMRGSSGPGLTSAIWKHQGVLPEKPTIARALISIVIVGMGAALGREAALKQTGGVLGKRVSDLFRLTPEQRVLLVACGTGAGMAAAYNVPLGGALFTLEVLLGTVSLSTAVAAFATSFLATAVAWLLLPNQSTYVIPYLPATSSLMGWSLICGPLMGLGAVLFVRGIHWAKDSKPGNWTIIVLPIVAFALLGLASVPLPQLLGNGKNVVQLAFEARITGALLILLLVLRPLATMLCLRAGTPGGLFTPTMTFGSLLGAALGQGWSRFDPGADQRSCALIGSAAVLAAATQAPISSVAFILELTYNTNTLMVPMLLAVVGATWTYHQFETRTSY